MEHLKEIRFLVIHHSQRDKDCMEFIKVRHKQKRGWEDIGYHYIIEKNGNLKKGRDEKFMGAHVKGYNQNSISICLIGNLDENSSTKKQFKTLIKFLKKKMKKYDIPNERIVGHREFPNVKKTCPGIFVKMNHIRKLLD